MRIYPEKGILPTKAELYGLAAAVLPMGLSARVGRERTKSGYRPYVEIMRPVEFGAEKAAEKGDKTE